MVTESNTEIRVLVADDDEDQRVLLEAILLGAPDVKHIVTTVPDGRTALGALREQVFDVALLDLNMPGLDGLEVLEAVENDPTRPQVVYVSGKGTVATATRAMKLGAYDFVEKPVEAERLRTLVWKAAAARRVLARSARLEEVMHRETSAVPIITGDSRMETMLRLLGRIAPSDVSVLVVGESGTGKELIAREVHRLSTRHPEPLVALNCAAVPENLAESELFGHEKGAFTGAATRKIGLIELSDGGTLFLDEIGDLDAPLQAKLLRALESRLFRRVGGVKELPANFRLVSATNRPLQKLVDEGTFRGDLFYRINAVVLELPPLRDRVGDILTLARYFLRFLRPNEGDWTLSTEAADLLERYQWPGNIRELKNVIERAALLAHDRTIQVADLGTLLNDAVAEAPVIPVAGAAPADRLPSLDLARLEEMAIRTALDQTDWHQGRASDVLGVSSRTLHRKIKTLGLQRPL